MSVQDTVNDRVAELLDAYELDEYESFELTLLTYDGGFRREALDNICQRKNYSTPNALRFDRQRRPRKQAKPVSEDRMAEVLNVAVNRDLTPQYVPVLVSVLEIFNLTQT